MTLVDNRLRTRAHDHQRQYRQRVDAGGEPLEVPGLLDILARKQDGIFLVFTNAIGLDEAAIETVAKAGNVLPVVSLEGDGDGTDARRGDGMDETVRRAMELLRDARVPFAYCTMVTHENLRKVTSHAYNDRMWDAGARFGFLVDYVPVAATLDERLVLTPADRAFKRAAVEALQAAARPFVGNFPEGEYKSGGCLSAGTGFVHVSATGDVEPCTFAHLATHNLRTSTYLDSLDSSFFHEPRVRFARRPNPDGTCMLLTHSAEVKALHRLARDDRVVLPMEAASQSSKGVDHPCPPSYGAVS